MNIPKSDLRYEFMRGTGPGGQHKNKRETACRVTHIPTGIQSYSDRRSRLDSARQALEGLIEKLEDVLAEKRLSAKKRRRDSAIKNKKYIRTYDFKKGLVRDHRSGKTAPIKDVLGKGKIDLLRDENDLRELDV
jgi:peptide chain release factor 1